MEYHGKLFLQTSTVALLLVFPITLLLCLPTNLESTCLGLVLHVYINATTALIAVAFLLLKGLLLCTLNLGIFALNFLLWLFNCNETVAQLVVTQTDDGPGLQARLLEALLLLLGSGLLTTIIYLYLNPAKPAKKEGETILLLNSKGDWEYAPSAKREAGVKF